MKKIDIGDCGNDMTLVYEKVNFKYIYFLYIAFCYVFSKLLNIL